MLSGEAHIYRITIHTLWQRTKDKAHHHKCDWPAVIWKKELEMRQQEAIRQPTAAAPIAIRSSGLSVEAREMFDRIAKRAYEIFEAKGRIKGRELEHWLEAESELFESTVVNVKESRDGLTVLADVPGFTPHELEVDLEPNRVTIIGKHQT